MDLEKDLKPVLGKKYSNSEHRDSTSKRTDTFANNVNPFNTVGNYHERRLRDKLQKRNNGEIINIFKHNISTPNTISVTSSDAQSTYEIKQELIDDVYSNHPQTHKSMATVFKRSDKNISQPMCDFQATPNLRNLPKVPSYRRVRYSNDIKYNIQDHYTRVLTDKPRIIDDNRYTDNTIHCPPSPDMYNEEFVFKTMQQQARLQKIVRKLVIARQKEKQREEWNNYINELKNKHRYYSNEPTTIVPQYVPDNDELFEDFWYTRRSLDHHYPRHDFQIGYERYNNVQSRNYNNILYPQSNHHYGRNSYCYPTSSQGRLMMLNKERERLNIKQRPLNKYKPIIEVEKNLNKQRFEGTQTKCDQTSTYAQINDKVLNTKGVGTGNVNQVYNNIESFHTGLFKNQLHRMEIKKLKEQLLQTDNLKESPLESIEEKLNILIKSVNSVIVEIRGQKNVNTHKCPITKSRSISCTLRELSNLVLSRNKPESYEYLNDTDVYYTTVNNEPNHLVISEISTSAPKLTESNEKEIRRIIEEEMEKSEKIKRDIQELLHTQCKRQCSVEIAFDIPTREVYTAVGSSLPKTQCFNNKEANITTLISSNGVNSRQMTIAVNTDPLGLCALLQVSADTIKQLLSYLMNLNYCSSIPASQMSQGPCVAHFMCNVCGDTFTTPSQLSEHIESHYSGLKRDCCVCRHMLNLQSDRIGLFSCKYCGKRFTRAYCCELHQQACAKRFGRRHDVPPSLMILR